MKGTSTDEPMVQITIDRKGNVIRRERIGRPSTPEEIAAVREQLLNLARSIGRQLAREDHEKEMAKIAARNDVKMSDAGSSD
ncbi:hypothetical protein [Methylocella sp. CPCC 101449]|uniref:hypothetical protein n=1 Tax=Methylocella sp. CPCC 101449 TaxID=2987531 RepID=UPI00288CC483|nr:hypothetical protein [Methylocella sp. CPCC 101449]MDT2022832.1 hypothetical protein [Methylocella sp. CPCC 101449]